MNQRDKYMEGPFVGPKVFRLATIYRTQKEVKLKGINQYSS